MQQSSCEIRFGVSGLHNPSLIKQFYPSDLPEDWRLDYYSNEFRLILVECSDLGIDLSNNEGTVSRLSDALDELLEEVEGDDFILLFDLSGLPSDTIEKEFLKYGVGHWNTGKENLYFINLNKLIPEEVSDVLTLRMGMVFDDEAEGRTPEAIEKSVVRGNAKGRLICFVAEKQAIEPLELRKLIELIRARAFREKVEAVDVIFSSAHNALDNCCNAVMLESMM